MAVTEIPSPSLEPPLPRRKPQVPEFEPLVFDLSDKESRDQVASYLGHNILINTTSQFFVSPLWRDKGPTQGLHIKFGGGPKEFDEFETTLRGVDRFAVYFDYQYDELGLDRPVVAIASPNDKNPTKLWVPTLPPES